MDQTAPAFPKEMKNIYKSKLQEFCHRKKWALPRYSCMKDGPDHNPLFKASVVVNGLNFDTLGPCKSLKEAHNEVARLAFLHFSSGSEPTYREPKTTETHKNPGAGINPDSEQQYSTKLQIYAKRKKLGVPTYCVQREGAIHDLCFKATVSIGGESFKSPGLYKSAKEAEDAAARFALMSLTSAAFQESITRSYKSLLQELAQSKGDFMPAYKTSVSGKPHNLTFLSTVEIDGEVFHGTAANSKKQAEDNAAKVAYMSLMEGKPHQTSGSSSGSSDYKNKILDLAPLLNAFAISEKKENSISGCPSSPTSVENGEEEEKVFDNIGPATADSASLATDKLTRNRNSDTSLESLSLSPKESESSFAMKAASHCSAPSVVDCSMKRTAEMKTYLLCNRVKVYNHIPNMTFPKGTVLLPIREGEWVVANLEFPNEK